MEEEISQLKEKLSLYQQAETDILNGGAIKSIRKDDFLTTFTSLDDLRKAIRNIKTKITLMEINS